MIAQIQLPASAVLPTVFDAVPPSRPPQAPEGEEPSEFTLHLLAMELVKHSPRTALRLAASGRRKLGVQ
jgi:hypothetical protein